MIVEKLILACFSSRVQASLPFRWELSTSALAITIVVINNMVVVIALIDQGDSDLWTLPRIHLSFLLLVHQDCTASPQCDSSPARHSDESNSWSMYLQQLFLHVYPQQIREGSCSLRTSNNPSSIASSRVWFVVQKHLEGDSCSPLLCESEHKTRLRGTYLLGRAMHTLLFITWYK